MISRSEAVIPFHQSDSLTRMNILFLSTVYPHATAPTRGTFNWQLCQALRNHAGLRIVAPRSWLDGFRGHDATTEIRNTVPTEWPTFVYPPRVMRGRHGQFLWWSAKSAVQHVTQQFPVDWVLSYWAYPDGDAAVRAARAIGAKSAVMIGGSDVLLLPTSGAQRESVIKVLRESDLIITVCDGLRQRCLELGADPARVVTIFQGVDRAVFRQGSRAEARFHLRVPLDAPAFVWVGRMAKVKRVDLLLRAFRKLHETEPEARLYLIGSGSQENELRALTQTWALTEHVQFVGPVKQADLPLWYQAADATVLSSHSEGLPNVLRESLACGTPFVATNVGSVSEIADPTHSVVVPPGDEAALAAALRDILDPIYQAGAMDYQPLSWEQSARDVVRAMFRIGKQTARSVIRATSQREEVRS